LLYPTLQSIEVIREKKGSISEMKITIIKQQETGKWCRPLHAVGTKLGQQSRPLCKTKNEFESQRTLHIYIYVHIFGNNVNKSKFYSGRN
jgi:hypothetical protein